MRLGMQPTASPSERCPARERIAELRREWSLERIRLARAARVRLFGMAVHVRIGGRHHLLRCEDVGVLLRPTRAGWRPTDALLRQLGYRHQRAIDLERVALERPHPPAQPPFPRSASTVLLTRSSLDGLGWGTADLSE
jgi:hypothetical protein